MFINDWKISRKLIAAFGAVVLTIGALGGVVAVQLSEVERTSAAVEKGHSVLETVDLLKNAVSVQESNTRAYLIVQNPTYIERIKKAQDAFATDIAALRTALQNIEGADQRIDALEGAVATYVAEIVEKETSLASNPATHSSAVELVRSGVAAKFMQDVTAALDLIGGKQQERLDTAIASQRDASFTALMAIIAGVGVAALMAVLFGWWLSRNTSRPITMLSATMRSLAAGENNVEVPCMGRKDELGGMADAVLTFKKNAVEKIALEAAKAKEAAEDSAAIAALAAGLSAMASGDLRHRISAPFAAKTQKLKDDFNSAIAQLDDSVSIILSNAAGIRSGAGEISHAADDLSRRTEQQAANLEETAAALDQITATVKKTAQGASQANVVVGTTRSDAEKSGEVVRSAVQAMGRISDSARQINQIIGVIDEIAFQTNLLALNAGVEAARAGEAGRGFAVVASEVRALAQRSADAAKEIKGLITTSSEQVDTGVNLVGQAGEALHRIVEQISQISTLVSEITASAQEQATGLNQVNTAVNQMDQVTQQNAAMVEESTAASHALAQESSELNRLVSQFKVTKAPVVHEPQTSKAAAKSDANRSVVQLRATSQQKALPEPSEADWQDF
jgi:methyl-accepting chemotaxis protein